MMYTADREIVSSYQKLREAEVTQPPVRPIRLLAVLGFVALVVAAVVALSFLVGGPVTEVHDSWMNIPAEAFVYDQPWLGLGRP